MFRCDGVIGSSAAFDLLPFAKRRPQGIPVKMSSLTNLAGERYCTRRVKSMTIDWLTR